MHNTIARVENVLAHLSGRPPTTLNATPKELIFSRGKLGVFRAIPVTGESAAPGPPVMLIPPLMVQPYIYDLGPTHSMVATLRAAGLDTYSVDLGVPDRGDRHLRLDDYVTDFVPTCIDAVLGASGADQLAIVGYCMGGLFGLIHVATLHDHRVRAVVTIGSPINFSQMKLVRRASGLVRPLVSPLLQVMGNVPGELSSVVFKALTWRQVLQSYLHLITADDDQGDVQKLRAINYWVNDLIPYPREAFLQMFHEVVIGNKLMTGEMHFSGKRCDLSSVKCALLSFAGSQDTISPPTSVKEIVEIVGSEDKSFLEAPGGHVGVVAGSAAPGRVWEPTADWLLSRLAG